MGAGEGFDWRSVRPGVTSVGRHRIEDLGGSAGRVILSIEWSGLLAPVVNLLYGRLTQQYLETEAQCLKDRVTA